MGQDHYGIRRRKAFNGMDHDGSGRTRTLTNDNPRAKQIEAVTVDSAADDTNYALEINTLPVSITSGTGATKTTIRDQLIAKINANSSLYGDVIAEAKDADELYVTSRYGGRAFLISATTGNLSIAQEQANAVAEPVEFGKVVIFDDPSAKTGKLAKATNLIAQEETLTLTFDDGIDAIIEIYIDGVARKFSVAQATAASNSVTALASEINDGMPAETVIATTDGDDLILTSELAGKPFKVSTGFGSGRDTGAWARSSNASQDTDLNKAFAGMTVESSMHAVQDGETSAKYEANYPMSVKFDRARLRVAVEEDISTNSDVYVRLAANGSLTALGGVRATADTGCVKLEGARFLERLDATFAVIEIP